MIYIHPYEWSSHYAGHKRDITVNSNCDSVELKVSGISKGTLTPSIENDHTVIFKGIVIEEGILSAEGVKGGVRISEFVQMPKAPAKLMLHASHQEISADRTSISLIKVDITDQSGVHVYGARPTLHFEVLGPGKLVGPSVYTTDIDKDEAMEGSLYFDVPIYMPVRSTYQPGVITVKVTAEGLEEASIEILSQSVDLKREGFGVVESKVLEPEHAITIINELTASDKATIGEQINRALAYEALAFTIVDIQLINQEERQYKQLIDHFIRQQNPMSSEVYRTEGYLKLLALMFVQLKKDQGIIVADDYNFIIRSFNDWYKISIFISKTQMDNSLKVKLQLDYADRMITQGHEIELIEEMTRILEKFEEGEHL